MPGGGPFTHVGLGRASFKARSSPIAVMSAVRGFVCGRTQIKINFCGSGQVCVLMVLCFQRL